jgi:hydrogenase nickel incorporation protein HypA/HybF
LFRRAAQMHELSLTEALIALVEDEGRKHGCSRVRTVRVEIGAISAIEPEAMRFCFDAVTRGTIAEGAVLDILSVPGRGWCLDCGKEVALSGRLDPCPDCGSDCVQPMAGGDDLRLKELEVE